MPQTMLILFAIMLAGQLIMVWQRDSVRSQQNLIRIELESQARGVAGEVFEILENKPFDRNGAALTPEGLTLEEDFGSALAFPGGIQDLDDVHDMSPYRAERIITDPNGDPQALEYWVTAEVAYVSDDSGIELIETGGVRTFYKIVTLSIRNDHLDRYFGTGNGIEVSRVYSLRQ